MIPAKTQQLRLRDDLIAGLTVAVVALPLALAFGVASGVGASAGMTSAIVAGFIAAAAGGSKFQVSGPTGAMTVVLIPIVTKFGTSGVLAVGLIAGVLMIGAGVLRLGHYVNRLPTSLIEGFTAGIAVVIALQQVPLALDAPKATHDKVVQRASDAVAWYIHSGSVGPLAIALATFAIIAMCERKWPRWPVSLAAVVAVSLAVQLGHVTVSTIGTLPQSVGRISTEFLTGHSWNLLLVPAVGVALLAILESLLSATVADRMRGDGTHHDPNRELVGQGLANVVTPFFGGIPATAALARTAVNVRSGAQSRVAAMTHAGELALVVLIAPRLVGGIPLAALAGVLIATTSYMIKPRELWHTARASGTDAAVLTTTFVLTIFMDLITAVAVGVVLTAVLTKVSLGRATPPVDEEETLGD